MDYAAYICVVLALIARSVMAFSWFSGAGIGMRSGSLSDNRRALVGEKLGLKCTNSISTGSSVSMTVRRPLSEKHRVALTTSTARKTFGTLVGMSVLLKRPLRANAVIETDSNNMFIDRANNFALYVPPGWSRMPKSTPTARLMQYQVEESLFVATQFAEGAAVSVTRSNARRLLVDFKIDWYFAPLESIGDIGSPELVAELLILQRQGDFEKKVTPSVITGAKFVGKNELEFDFDTPLAASVTRRSICRTLFDPRSLSLVTVWTSALQPVYEADYGAELLKIRSSLDKLDERDRST